MNEENDIRTPFELEIVEIVRSDRRVDEKKERLSDFHDFDLSQALPLFDPAERKKFYALLDGATLADVFEHLDPEDAVVYVKELPLPDAARILNGMEGDDLVDLLQAFKDRDERVRFLALLTLERRNGIKAMIDYDDDLVGSIMNDVFVAIPPTLTVKQAIRALVDAAGKTEFINNLYVVEDGVLVGVLSLREIISSGNRPDTPIRELMTTNLVTVTPTTRKEEAIGIMRDYDFMLLPVVGDDGRILGILSFDDMIEAQNEESDEDYAKLAAVADVEVDDEKESAAVAVRKRMPWLIILLLLDVVTSSVVAGFEGVIAAIPTLALFMPMVLSMCGNTGTQSLGVIIQLFADNRLETRKERSIHLFHELLTGLVNGLVLGVVVFGLVLGLRTLDGASFSETLPFAAVIALAIAVALTVSTVAGAFVPILCKLVKIDPAVASGPFITTINDILSLLIYFGLAALLLGGLM
ncbi:MAG: magnesium transporter [Candidatus Izemoplasmatales bacterium]